MVEDYPRSPKEMNEVLLKDYLDAKLNGVEKAVVVAAAGMEKRLEGMNVYFESRLSGVDKAISVAAAGMEKRLEGMNEFRNQLKDQTGTFITRAEHDAILNRMNEDIRMLRESRAELAGKASQMSVNIALVIAIIGIVISSVSVFRGISSSPSDKTAIQQTNK